MNSNCDSAQHWDEEISQPGMKNIACWQFQPFVNSPLKLVNPNLQLPSFLLSIVVKSLSINQLEEQTPAQFIIIFLQVIRGSNKAAGVDRISGKSMCQPCMFLSNLM